MHDGSFFLGWFIGPPPCLVASEGPGDLLFFLVCLLGRALFSRAVWFGCLAESVTSTEKRPLGHRWDLGVVFERYC